MMMIHNDDNDDDDDDDDDDEIFVFERTDFLPILTSNHSNLSSLPVIPTWGSVWVMPHTRDSHLAAGTVKFTPN